MVNGLMGAEATQAILVKMFEFFPLEQLKQILVIHRYHLVIKIST